MPDPTFSITQTLVITPVTNFCDDFLGNHVSFGDALADFALSELVGRVIALSTSVFALIDTVIHLGTGIWKGSSLVTRRIFNLNPIYTGKEVGEHFEKTGKYLLLTFVGSIGGFVCPYLFYLFKDQVQAPPPASIPPASPFASSPSSIPNISSPFSNNSPSIPATRSPYAYSPTTFSTNYRSAIKPPRVNDSTTLVYTDDEEVDGEIGTEEIRKLADKVVEGTEIAPFNNLQTYWKKSTLSQKHNFVQIFSSDKSEKYKAVRDVFAEFVYKPINKINNANGYYNHNLYAAQEQSSLSNKKVRWLSNKELASQVPTTEKTQICLQGFYFHATRLKESMLSILEDGKIEYRQQGAFPGAFVATTRPQPEYGNYIFVLKKNIEHLSTLSRGLPPTATHVDSYWAGFSDDIPVNDKTLAYIIVNGTDRERQDIEDQAKIKYSGKKIIVRTLNEVRSTLNAISDLGMGIPATWANSAYA